MHFAVDGLFAFTGIFIAQPYEEVRIFRFKVGHVGERLRGVRGEALHNRSENKEIIVMGRIVTLLMVAAALLISTGGAFASVLYNVQFTATNQIDEPYTTVLPAYVGSAVIGSTGDIWNQFPQDVTSGSLNDAANTPGLVAFSTSTSSMGGGNFNGGFSNVNRGVANLMEGYLYNTSPTNPEHFSFTGLSPNTAYELYVYTQGDKDATGRKTSVSVDNGLSWTTTNAGDGTASTFILGQNYLIVNPVTDGTGSMDIQWKAGSVEADINALQLLGTSTAVPEPSTYLLLCLSLGAVGFARKRLSRSGQ